MAARVSKRVPAQRSSSRLRASQPTAKHQSSFCSSFLPATPAPAQDLPMADPDPPILEPPPTPTTPKQAPLAVQPTTPSKPTPYMDTNGPPSGDVPLPPQHHSSQAQLALELKQQVASATQSRISQLQAMETDAGSLVMQASIFIAHWEKQGLPEAITLGQGLKDLLTKFTQQLRGEVPSAATNPTTTHPQPRGRSYAQACQIDNNPSQQPGLSASTRPLKLLSKPQATNPRHLKLPRTFIRLPEDHPARLANPHATLTLLRQHPIPQISKGVKEVQKVPSGLALIPQNPEAGTQLPAHYSTLKQIFPIAKLELEQEWDTFVLPHVPSVYSDYAGEQVTVTDQMVQEEFRFQTNLEPHYFHKSPHEGSRTFILYLPHKPNQKKIPFRVSLFGESVHIKRKPYTAKVIQCHQCWGFHPPHKCNRKPRCCLCSSTDHTEKFHPETLPQSPKCTNCLGPHRADHPECKARPLVSRGTIQHLPQSQLRALRKANYNRQVPTTSPTTIPAPSYQAPSTIQPTPPSQPDSASQSGAAASPQTTSQPSACLEY